MHSISGRMAEMGGGEKRPMPGKPAAQGTEGGHWQIHAHEDGSAHSVSPDGQEAQHPSVHHAVTHMLAHHEPEHGHSVVQHHMAGHMSHHAKDGGEVSGPHEGKTLDEVKQKMEEVAGGEGEGGQDQYDHEGPSEGGGKGLFA